MQHRIIGTVMPVLEVDLDAGESIVAESGELSWMSQSIQMTTSTRSAGSKGVMGVLKRAVSGGTLFMTEYQAQGAPGMVAFATKVPGHILALDVEPGREYRVHQHGYLAGTSAVELTVAFQQSLGAGFFGGEGFVLQKVAGQGTAWIEIDGEVITYDLAPGQNLRVHPGHVAIIEQSVSFELTRIKGIKNMVFGGDGIFLASLTGPGKVWLQSLPLPVLAHAISRHLPQAEAQRQGLGGAINGG